MVSRQKKGRALFAFSVSFRKSRKMGLSFLKSEVGRCDHTNSKWSRAVWRVARVEQTRGRPALAASPALQAIPRRRGHLASPRAGYHPAGPMDWSDSLECEEVLEEEDEPTVDADRDWDDDGGDDDAGDLYAEEDSVSGLWSR